MRTSIKSRTSSNFGQMGPQTMELAALEHQKISHRLIMEKWCLYASLFIFDWIIITVAGNQDRHKSSVKFHFGPNQMTHFGVTCPWVTKISHFWTWISLKPAGQSWSNFMCSIIGLGERLHKVLGQIDFGTLDSGERSLPFGLLVICSLVITDIWATTWQNQQNDCAHSEDSDQPGHLPSLISLHCALNG